MTKEPWPLHFAVIRPQLSLVFLFELEHVLSIMSSSLRRFALTSLFYLSFRSKEIGYLRFFSSHQLDLCRAPLPHWRNAFRIPPFSDDFFYILSVARTTSTPPF